MKKHIFFTLSLFLVFAASLSSEFVITDWLLQSFPEATAEEIVIQPLSGGLSGTSMYKIDVQGKPYVLRIHQSDQLSLQDQREHHALLEAAKRKIAPQIIAISSNHKAIIMEFIEDKTITIDQAKTPEIYQKIAEAMLQAHQIPSHVYSGETILSKAERCTRKVLQDGLGDEEAINGALALVNKYRNELSHFSFCETNVHGDLNPRNIFFTDGRVLFIDWAESNHEDPFYDLTYFSLKHDFNQEEELGLLKAYLKRLPTNSEVARFQLQKKIHQAFWSLTNLYLAQAELDKNPKQQIDKKAKLYDWGNYQKAYAESGELSAQYFYDLSRLNFQLAQ